ncbi:hypothetical protein ABZP36_004507 [Zizania latifolia]
MGWDGLGWAGLGEAQSQNAARPLIRRVAATHPHLALTEKNPFPNSPIHPGKNQIRFPGAAPPAPGHQLQLLAGRGISPHHQLRSSRSPEPRSPSPPPPAPPPPAASAPPWGSYVVVALQPQPARFPSVLVVEFTGCAGCQCAVLRFDLGDACPIASS